MAFMKRTSISIYSAVISCVFAFAVVFFAANILYEYAHGGQRAGRTFEGLSSAIRNGGDIQAAVGSLDDYAALCIYRNGGAVFAYPDDAAFVSEGARLVAVYRDSVSLGGDVYSVAAALYVLRPSVIFRCARISFAVVLAATLITAALIVYLSLADGGGEEGGGDDAKAALEDEGRAEDAQIEEALVEECAEAAEEEMLVWDFSGIAAGPDVAESEGVEEGGVPEEETVEAEEALPALPEPEASSLPAPLEERLSEALARAEETGGDVSLLLVSAFGAASDDALLRSMRVHLFGRFSEEGSVLEVGEGRFAVVRSGLSIGEAESVADSIQSELCGLLDGSGAKCCIGISSKSERSIAASRLVFEAEEALRHAEEDSEPSVVAFHVDVEKYREYVKSV